MELCASTGVAPLAMQQDALLKECWHSPESWFVGCSEPIACEGEARFALLGDVFNLNQVLAAMLSEPPSPGASQDEKSRALMRLMLRHGVGPVCRKLNGSFAFVLYDGSDGGRIIAGTDPLGDLYLYWSDNGSRIILSSNLLHFDSRNFPLNRAWLDRYFRGDDGVKDATALVGVQRIKPGYIVEFTNGECREVQYFNLPNEMRVAQASHTFHVRDEAVDFVSGIMNETIDALAARYKRPALMLSQGIDSLMLLSLMRRRGFEPKTYTQFYADKHQNLFQEVHAGNLQAFGGRVANQCDTVDFTAILAQISPSVYRQPDCNYWPNLLVYRTHGIRRAVDDGCDLVIQGNVADEAFLHRYKYLVLSLIEKLSDEIEVSQLRRIVIDNDRPNHAYEDALAAMLALFDEIAPDAADYSLFPGEITFKLLRRFFCEYGGQFFNWLAGDATFSKGISLERELRFATKTPVLSPFNDCRLFLTSASLSEELLLQAMQLPILQDGILKRHAPAARFVPKWATFPISLRRVPVTEPVRELLAAGVDLLYTLGVERADHYACLLHGVDAAGGMNMELFRVLTFYFWYRNWHQNPVSL